MCVFSCFVGCFFFAGGGQGLGQSFSKGRSLGFSEKMTALEVLFVVDLGSSRGEVALHDQRCPSGFSWREPGLGGGRPVGEQSFPSRRSKCIWI